jgi:hypothetical protein
MRTGNKTTLDQGAMRLAPLAIRRKLMAGVATLGMLAGTAGAAEYFENPDAGDIPSTAQSPAGPELTALVAINGDILDEFDQDMFKIFIDDPVAFSASTNNPDTIVTPFNDTMLYLFDENGLAVLASDDITSSEPLNFKTTLSAGSLDDAGGGAGIYYLAISLANNYPTADALNPEAGEIWNPDRLSGTTDTLYFGKSGPPLGGPGELLPVAGWGHDPWNPGGGDYRIELTGVPEPAEMLMLTAGLALLGILARRRSGERLRVPKP